MTGQEFIDALEKEMRQRSKLTAEYTTADLWQDILSIRFCQRQPTSQEKAQEEDLVAAREEVAKLDIPAGAA